jgi:hypothetical protein
MDSAYSKILALARAESKQRPTVKIYINKFDSHYTITDSKNSNSIMCIRNGNEIAL